MSSEIDTDGAAAGGFPAPARWTATRSATAPGGAGLLPQSIRLPWEARFRKSVVGLDALLVMVAAAGTTFVSQGGRPDGPAPTALLVGAAALLTALLFLASFGAWDVAVLGQGSEEFNRVVRALVTCAVAVGFGGLLLKEMAVRPWVFGFVPLTGLLVLGGRYALRKSLHQRRDRGECLRPMLAIGTVEATADLINRTRRDRYNGWKVTAVCTPTGTGVDGAPDVSGVPVVGDLDSVTAVVQRKQYCAVSVSKAPGWGPHRMRQLAWDLEDVGADLVVDPGIMEVAGPRLHISPLDGLPLLRLTKPTLTGVPRVGKHLMDRIGAAVLLTLLVPVMLVIVVAVRCDGGPAFFYQTRIGRHGRPFKMIKFRSMVVDAEQRRAVLQAQNEGAGPLFKLRHDPRITRVGAVLRRYSLDELPQLFNVLSGSMSLVGPRPPLPSEVETYSRDAGRKLLVRPGLTGLWQVSGRSDLSWEESVRLDLRYVENWTLAQDILILWKTLGAVVKRNGAY